MSALASLIGLQLRGVVAAGQAPLLDKRLLEAVHRFGDGNQCDFRRYRLDKESFLSTRSELDEVAASQPIILMEEDYSLNETWNASIIESIKDVPVLMDNGRHDGARLKTRVSIQRYVNGLSSDERNLHIFQAHPSLLHTRLRSFTKATRPIALRGVDRRPIFSMGYEGTATFFHEHDVTWQKLLVGRKAWFLAPPSCKHHEFEDPVSNPCEWLNLENRSRLSPDVKICVQVAGETLFFPDHWMHATCNLGPGITVGIGAQGDLLSEVKRYARDGNLHETLHSINRSDTIKNSVASALLEAATFGHTPIVKMLLEGNLSHNPVGSSLPRPSIAEISDAVMSATEAGQLDVLKLFANEGVDLRGGGNGRTTRTFLWQAAWNGYASLVDYLAPQGMTSNTKQEALEAAAVGGSLDAVITLLGLGAKASGAAARAASKAGHVEILNSLLKVAARVDSKDVLGWQPLHFASLNGHVDVVKALLSHGAGVDVPNGGDDIDLVDEFAFPLKRLSGGWRPAHLAAFSGHIKVLSIVRGVGASLLSVDKLNQTPMDLAIISGQIGAEQWLRRHAKSEAHDLDEVLNSTDSDASAFEL